jgi:hypothetical protein
VQNTLSNRSPSSRTMPGFCAAGHRPAALAFAFRTRRRYRRRRTRSFSTWAGYRAAAASFERTPATATG